MLGVYACILSKKIEEIYGLIPSELNTKNKRPRMTGLEKDLAKMSSPLAASVTSHLFCISRERLDVIFEVVRCAESSAGARPKGPCCAPLEASPHRTTLGRRGARQERAGGKGMHFSSCSTSLRKRRAITEASARGGRSTRGSGRRCPCPRGPNRSTSSTRSSGHSCRACATNSGRRCPRS